MSVAISPSSISFLITSAAAQPERLGDLPHRGAGVDLRRLRLDDLGRLVAAAPRAAGAGGVRRAAAAGAAAAAAAACCSRREACESMTTRRAAPAARRGDRLGSSALGRVARGRRCFAGCRRPWRALAPSPSRPCRRRPPPSSPSGAVGLARRQRLERDRPPRRWRRRPWPRSQRRSARRGPPCSSGPAASRSRGHASSPSVSVLLGGSRPRPLRLGSARAPPAATSASPRRVAQSASASVFLRLRWRRPSSGS